MSDAIARTVERFLQLQQKIAMLEKKYERTPGSVKIIVVSKGQSAECIAALAQVGACAFAENFIQEAVPKIQQLQHLGLQWHFIGRIQRNKIRNIAKFFDIVHSIADVVTAQHLDSISGVVRPPTVGPLSACLQVNLLRSVQKSGFSEQNLNVPSVIHQLQHCDHLKLMGLMTILDAGLSMQDAYQAFCAVRELLMTLNYTYGLKLDVLSMGMSNDYEPAIAAGATWLRLGRAIMEEI